MTELRDRRQTSVHSMALTSIPPASPLSLPVSCVKAPLLTARILRVPLINSSPSPSYAVFSPKPISINAPRAAFPPQKYSYPDPNPEFAQSETHKFRAELLKKLFKDKETFGDDLDKVVEVCSEMFSEFLQEEYGGPGTLLVEPFTDMLIALKEQNLPGAPLAARVALLWAQNYVDQDWEIWNSDLPN